MFTGGYINNKKVGKINASAALCNASLAVLKIGIYK